MSDQVRILAGDVRETLATLPDESVHCVVTSPPYFALRDYGVAGQIGLEPTLDEYIETMVGVFREVRRVLRKDGVAWVNMGDSYMQHGGRGAQGATSQRKHATNRRPTDGLKAKDLCMVPHRVAIALQADGWWVRQDCVWNKPTAMPESCTDRPSRSHEYVFLLTKSAKYFYDADAVRTPLAAKTFTTYGTGFKSKGTDGSGGVKTDNFAKSLAVRKPRLAPLEGSHGTMGHDGNGMRMPEKYSNVAGANLRTVWTIASKPYPGAHFATFPPELAELCIASGSSPRGCCPTCGAPWQRITETKRMPDRPGRVQNREGDSLDEAHGDDGRAGNRYTTSVETIGWEPTCRCDAGKPVPCTVLDPFAGTGTVGEVGVHMGRHVVLCELNPAYVELIRERLGLFAPARPATATTP